MKPFKSGAISCSLLCAFLFLGSVTPLTFTSCGKDPSESEPDIPGKLKLIPEKDVIFKWCYEYSDNIQDSLIVKIWVPDGKRDKFVGCDNTLTWNKATKKDYSEGKGAVTTHTNDKEAIDAVLVSSAEHGLKDSTYVYSIQKYDAGEDITYIGEFKYVVKARPADAEIDLGTFNMAVSDADIKIHVYPINAVYTRHKEFYSRYSLDEMAAGFISKVKVDSRKVTIDGKTVEDEVNCDFDFDGAGESSCLYLILNKAGKWKVNINTHFGNVGYNFVATINAK